MNFPVSYLLSNTAFDNSNEGTPEIHAGVLTLPAALIPSPFSTGVVSLVTGSQSLLTNLSAIGSIDVPAAMVSPFAHFDGTVGEIISRASANGFARIADPPIAWPSGNASHLIAEWEGHVTEIGQQTFEARLRGIFGEGVDGELEEATIPVAEVAGPNKELFAVGALFRLCVSYEQYESGQIRRYTELVFRRLPAYRKQDLDAAIQRARERLSELRLE